VISALLLLKLVESGGSAALAIIESNMLIPDGMAEMEPLSKPRIALFINFSLNHWIICVIFLHEGFFLMILYSPNYD
jgi:hypothetical protein